MKPQSLSEYLSDVGRTYPHLYWIHTPEHGLQPNPHYVQKSPPKITKKRIGFAVNRGVPA